MAGNGVRIQTFTDLPIEEAVGDKLGIQRYADGLAEFIKNCNTPMTIAVQGDWGSGKTSMMNMVRQKLGKNIKTLWFNTWQYSQFNGGEQLSSLFINDLVDHLAAEDPDSTNIREAAKLLKLFTTAMVSKVAGDKMADMFREKFDEVKTASEVMVDFKEQFQNSINNMLIKKRLDRVVVFVDDLDRLNPARAVELLEILKLFLDCTSCVYVLAIDYDVVLAGAREKFGDLEEEKGRSFFDKIIQVPFKMPIANFEIDGYITDMLEALSVHVTDEERKKCLYNFIKDTVGSNPRAMKRLFNLYSLNSIVSNIKDDEQQQCILLALLCMQHSHSGLYDFIAEYSKELTKEDFKSMSSIETYGDMDDELLKGLEKYHIDEENREKYAELMEAFLGIAAKGKGLSEKDAEVLKAVIKVSSLTAVGNTAAGNRTGSRKEYWWEETYKYYKISEPIEKMQHTTWNNAKISGFTLFGKQSEATKFSEMLVKVLSGLYKKDPDGFMKVRKECTAAALITLFYGSKKIAMISPMKVPNTDIMVETSTNNNYKVRQLNLLMQEMNLDPGELSLELRLAHEADSTDTSNATTD